MSDGDSTDDCATAVEALAATPRVSDPVARDFARSPVAAALRTWREVLAIHRQIGEDLEAVHRAGLVHRDVKPDNAIVGAIHSAAMRALLPLFVLAACHPGAPAPPSAPAPAPASEFGFYLLAMTWAPHLCCAEPGKAECAQLAGSFAATHLTLHGLWPNFTDEQSRGKPRAWPQYCGAYRHCEQAEDPSCAPGVAVPDELARLAPGYVAGTGEFATHEWSKHGSCTRLSAAEYFGAELAAIHAIPGEATPDAVRAAAGADLARDDLRRAFGVPPDSIVLGCDAHCRLTQISFCVAKDAGDHPTTPIACTRNVTTSDYDNGCVTRGCQRVAVQAAGACDARPDHAR